MKKRQNKKWKIKQRLDRQTNPKDLTRQVQEVEDKVQNEALIKQEEEKIQKSNPIGSHTDAFFYKDENYTLRMDLVTDPSIDVLYSVSYDDSSTDVDVSNSQKFVCKINLGHPFFIRFSHLKKGQDYMPVISIFKSLAMAEITAQTKGIRNVSQLRILFNQYIVR